MRMQKETAIRPHDKNCNEDGFSSKPLQRGGRCSCARSMKDSAPVCTLHSPGNSRDPLISPFPIPKKKMVRGLAWLPSTLSHES